MPDYNLDRLVIKPTLFCTANCKGCRSRTELHRSKRIEESLSVDHWRTVLRDARSLGLKEVTISGGEPTLYPHLMELIDVGKKTGLFVRLNTNGSRITEAFAEDLLAAGLDAVSISIYSHTPEIHDAFRRQKGLWNKAVQAVRIFAELKRKRYPDFFIRTMSIMLRENFRSLDDLILLHQQLGSLQMDFAYLEGDFSGRNLLSEAEITEFRNDVVPRLEEFCHGLDPRIREQAVHRVRNLFGPSVGTIENLAKGIYWHPGDCDVPKSLGLILANGDVHPCNIVEYTHEPVMGNLFEDSFNTIWESEAWNTFRMRLHDRCPYCPVRIYSQIPLTHKEQTAGQGMSVKGRFVSLVKSPIQLSRSALLQWKRLER